MQLYSPHSLDIKRSANLIVSDTFKVKISQFSVLLIVVNAVNRFTGQFADQFADPFTGRNGRVDKRVPHSATITGFCASADTS
ncbi:hypothetical protein D3C81_2108520 [compost metagenome]